MTYELQLGRLLTGYRIFGPSWEKTIEALGYQPLPRLPTSTVSFDLGLRPLDQAIEWRCMALLHNFSRVTLP